MLNKKEQRLRRARQTRIRIAEQGIARLAVNRTNLHIYASLISDDGARILASASTIEPEVRKQLCGSGKGGNVAAAEIVGKRIAERAKRRKGRFRSVWLFLSWTCQGAGRCCA